MGLYYINNKYQVNSIYFVYKLLLAGVQSKNEKENLEVNEL